METQEIVQKEIAMIGRNNSAECDVYFKEHKLSRDGAACLIAAHNRELILAYARYRSFDSFNEVELVKLHDEKLMVEYLELRKFLWTDAEVELIESTLVAAIKVLLQAFELSAKGEVALLKCGNRELIDEYNVKWGFRSREGKNLWLRIR